MAAARVARRCQHLLGRKARRQPPDCGAAAQHAQRLLPDFPHAGRRWHDRQRLRRPALHDQRRAAAQQRHARRWRDRHVPDGDRRRRHFRVPVRRRDSGIQGARRDVPGGVRPQPRQRRERRLQVGLEQLPRQRATSSCATRRSIRRTTFRSCAARSSGDFSRHQFGGSAGGPLRGGKMFYMVSFEGLREKAFASSHADRADARSNGRGTSRRRSPRTDRSFASSIRSRRGPIRPGGFIRDPVRGQQDSRAR